MCRGGVWRNDAVLQVPEPGAYLPRAVALTALMAELCRGREQFQGQAATVAFRGSQLILSPLWWLSGTMAAMRSAAPSCLCEAAHRIAAR